MRAIEVYLYPLGSADDDRVMMTMMAMMMMMRTEMNLKIFELEITAIRNKKKRKPNEKPVLVAATLRSSVRWSLFPFGKQPVRSSPASVIQAVPSSCTLLSAGANRTGEVGSGKTSLGAIRNKQRNG